MSHFAAVGFPIYGPEDAQHVFAAAFDRAVDRGDVVEHAGGRTATYRDPSGATLSIHVDRRSNFECCQPGLEGAFHARWRPTAIVPDEGCSFCDLVYAELLDGGDELIYPFALSLETLGTDRALIPFGEAGEVRFAGLWEEGEAWPDEAAFYRAQDEERDDEEEPVSFASRSLIPSGTFSFEGEALTSHVLAHGFVESVEERQNELGGTPFRVVRLDTLGGVFDTCLAPGTIEREELLAPGAVVRAGLWLVGRPLTLREKPGPVPGIKEERKRGFLRRLFR